MLRLFAVLLLLSSAACGPDRPDLSGRISPEARAQGYPELVPLTGLLRQTDDLLPRSAETEGQSLQNRAADLRRRAALLRRMAL